MSAGATNRRRVAEDGKRQASLERALTCAFWRTVRSEPMPVMAALEAAARALGTLYRETAAAHGPNGSCGCGWQPDPEADLIVLEAMLAAAMLGSPREAPAEDGAESAVIDLATIAVAGRA